MTQGSAPGSAAPQRGNWGWQHRGYLPHFDAPGAIQHVTYRLADALPRHVLARIEQDVRAQPLNRQETERRRRIESWLDAGHGSCVLRHPQAAGVVIDTWKRFNGERYRLLAFVVMPNHCHVLIECPGSCSLGRSLTRGSRIRRDGSMRTCWVMAALGRGAPKMQRHAALGRGAPRKLATPARGAPSRCGSGIIGIGIFAMSGISMRSLPTSKEIPWWLRWR